MPGPMDLLGQQFGNLTVIARTDDFITVSGRKRSRWLCRCMCGNEKKIISHSLRRGLSKSCGCLVRRRGIEHPGFKGGRYVNRLGYVRLYGHSDHPNAFKDGTILEHTYVMAESLGRPLLTTESVHHKNGNRSDNRLENLELWSSSQPPGQRVEDKLQWAKEIIQLYEGGK